MDTQNHAIVIVERLKFLTKKKETLQIEIQKIEREMEDCSIFLRLTKEIETQNINKSIHKENKRLPSADSIKSRLLAIVNKNEGLSLNEISDYLKVSGKITNSATISVTLSRLKREHKIEYKDQKYFPVLKSEYEGDAKC
jgi:hypothetical protein